MVCVVPGLSNGLETMKGAPAAVAVPATDPTLNFPPVVRFEPADIVPVAATLLHAIPDVNVEVFVDVSVMTASRLKVDGVWSVPVGVVVDVAEGSKRTFPELPSTLRSQDPNCLVVVR